MEWIKCSDQLPPIKSNAYQVVTTATKQYPEKSNYPNQGIKAINQDWVVRKWPNNFTHWMPLPELPKNA